MSLREKRGHQSHASSSSTAHGYHGVQNPQRQLPSNVVTQQNPAAAAPTMPPAYGGQPFEQSHTQRQASGNAVAQPQYYAAAAPSPAPRGYVVQNLEERYIRIRVLDNYLTKRVAEFGSQYHITTLHDHHRIVVKRLLTNKEILDLQHESFPGYPKHFFQ